MNIHSKYFFIKLCRPLRASSLNLFLFEQLHDEESGSCSTGNEGPQDNVIIRKCKNFEAFSVKKKTCNVGTVSLGVMRELYVTSDCTNGDLRS